MPDDARQAGASHGFRTRMSHAGRAGTKTHGFVNPPVHRGSTVLFARCADRIASASKRFDQALTYGTQGGPNHHALEDVISRWERGARTGEILRMLERSDPGRRPLHRASGE